MRERMVTWCVLSALAAPVGAQTSLISYGPGGVPANGQADARVALSADGRVAAWSTLATNHGVVDGTQWRDVYVRDLSTDAIEMVSVSSSGVQGNSASSSPSISGNGRYVAFQSGSTNLVVPSTNGTNNVFVRDRLLGTTEAVSLPPGGGQSSGPSEQASISADGSRVVFHSWASNLVAGDTNGTWDVFVHDRGAGTIERVSVDPQGGQGNGQSWYATISADGRFVAFNSLASNLVAGDTNGTWDVFVRDLQLQITTVASVTDTGTRPGAGGSIAPPISSDGRFVSFSSGHPFVQGEGNVTADVYVRDLVLGTTRLVSVSSAGGYANAYSLPGAISWDGRLVAFISYAENLVPNDTNVQPDLFLRDMESNGLERISVDVLGAQANAASTFISISGDGRRALFHSFGGLVPADTNGIGDVYLRQVDPLPAGEPFCSGDGVGSPCPCANSGLPGELVGCTNSLGIGGRLRAVGTPSVSGDTVVLIGDQMPNSSVLYFQGTSSISGGAGIAFGDGLRCAGGSIIRLGATTNSGGASQQPAPGGTPISVTGGVPPIGGSRTYQAWYRNAASFCTPSTFNLTNGLEIHWQS